MKTSGLTYGELFGANVPVILCICDCPDSDGREQLLSEAKMQCKAEGVQPMKEHFIIPNSGSNSQLPRVLSKLIQLIGCVGKSTPIQFTPGKLSENAMCLVG